MEQASHLKTQMDSNTITQKESAKMLSKLGDLLQLNLQKREENQKDAKRYMDIEIELHAQVHELSAITAYSEKIPSFVEAGLIESLLSVLQHPNIDISQMSMTILYELMDTEDLAESVQAKITQELAENSVWNLVL